VSSRVFCVAFLMIGGTNVEKIILLAFDRCLNFCSKTCLYIRVARLAILDVGLALCN